MVGVLLHAEQPQMDALDHLALRLQGLAIQERVHGLQRGASDPVIPHLVTQDIIIYLVRVYECASSIRCF